MARKHTVVLVEAALTVALCAVLGMFKVWEMPQGGSVSLGMLPLFVFALRRGGAWGLGVGLVYGLVDVLLGPVVVHPVQFVLDYPLPWMLVGLAGFATGLRGRGALGATLGSVGGVVLGALGRYGSHVISGVVFFGEYAEGQPVLAYSLAYNSFVLVSALACLVALLVVMPVLDRVVPAEAPAAQEPSES